MREKIKEKIKKILPIMICLVMVFGSCITSNASSSEKSFGVNVLGQNYFDVTINYISEAQSVYKDDTMKEMYECNFLVTSTDNKPVYAFWVADSYGTDGAYTQLLLYSESYFEFKDSPSTVGYFTTRSSDNKENAHYTPTYYRSEQSSRLSNGYYYEIISFNSWTDKYSEFGLPIFTSVFPVVNNVATSYNTRQLIDSITGDNIDSNLSVQYPALEYASSPTGSIEPPKNLSIYRGYSSADRQYKFQMQWDKPSDTNLNVEVMYNIHWKDGVLGMGSHIYKKYLHITNEDGMSAQNNKLTYLEDDFLKAYFESENMELPSVYNITEIYVRFSKEIDGIVNYSLWRKIEYTNLDEGNGFDEGEDDFIADSSTGAFDTSDNWIDQSVENGEIVDGSDKENAKAPGLDADGNNITPPSSDTLNPDTWDEDVTDVFKKFGDTLKSAFEFMGDFPSMISEFFGFLPPWIIGCITLGILMAIILRIIGR